ncbi:hypothetical protein VNO78_16116 [Psophocarpus tetragonolobus]|uniref:Uncharacterized protein n=1 Tax=Psophocarpus tetragonolobus TaxID=3891 RepID=A0AAN9SH99_PSOTE
MRGEQKLTAWSTRSDGTSHQTGQRDAWQDLVRSHGRRHGDRDTRLAIRAQLARDALGDALPVEDTSCTRPKTSNREQAQDASCTGPKSDDPLMAEDGLSAGTRAKAQEALSAGPKSSLKRGSKFPE